MRVRLWRATVGVCWFVVLGVWSRESARAASPERVICVVPLTGSGTLADPRRPLFVSMGQLSEEDPDNSKHALSSERIAFHSILTDDGQHAILEFVAPPRALRKEILAADPTTVRVFEQNKISAPVLQEELRKYKKDFDLKSFHAGAR